MTGLAPTVRRTRFFIVVVLRTTAVVLILAGLYALTQVIHQIFSFGFMSAITIFHDRGFSWTGRSVGLLIPGIALGALSRPISRWITPLPRRACLQCGYELRNLTAATCPECGTPVD